MGLGGAELVVEYFLPVTSRASVEIFLKEGRAVSACAAAESKTTTSVEVSGEQHLFLGQRVLAAAYNIRKALMRESGIWFVVVGGLYIPTHPRFRI